MRTLAPMLLFFVAATAGCGGEAGDATQVMVILEASDALGASAARLVVLVRSQEGEVVEQANLAIGSEVVLPAHVPVIPRGGDASRTFAIEAVLLDAADATISRVTSTEGFVADSYREVTLTFPDTLSYDTSPGSSAIVDAFDASGIGTTDVAGATLTLSPSQGELVLLLASAQLDAPGGTMGIQAELVVDGSARARGQSATYQGQSIQFVSVLEGDGAAHDASLRLSSDVDRSYSISDVRLYAIPIPSFADLHFVRGEPETIVETEWVRVAELAFEPSYAGDYVVLMGAGMSESPGGSGVELRFDGPSGSYPRSSEYDFGREPVLPVLAARVEHLEARAASLTVEARAASTMATAFDPVIVAMRADAFPAVASILDTSAIIAPDGMSRALPSLVLEAQTLGTHWLTISDTVARASNGDVNGVMGISYDRDGAEVGERIRGSVAGEDTTISFIDVFEGSAPVTLEATMSPRDGTLECRSVESSVLAIRL